MEREQTLLGVIISTFIIFIATSDKTLVDEGYNKVYTCL